MKYLISIVVFILGVNLYAVDEYVSDVYYGNGIMTSFDEAKTSLDLTVRPKLVPPVLWCNA
jgi:hypothetical protein